MNRPIGTRRQLHPGAGASWGAIAGTLSAQTDLQAALDAKAVTGHNHDGTYATAAQGTKADSAVQPAGLTKAAVGLGNCDNTADSAKPVSTAQQTALDLKANLASPTFTGTVVIPTPFTIGAVSMTATGTELNFVDGVTSAIQTQLDGKQASDAQLTSLAALSYAGNTLKVVRVNAGETDFELATLAGGGDVTGPASATDNAIARFDGTGGKTLQNSGPTIGDAGRAWGRNCGGR